MNAVAFHHWRMEITNPNLCGKLLIAMPQMNDPRFAQSVIYLCAHSDEGAMGLIVNKPATSVRFRDLLEQLKIPNGPETRNIRVHIGGPVENSRGFVLHTADYKSGAGTLEVDSTTRMTATLDVLEDIAKGRGPAQSMLALGYAGWGPGQLEDEISRNGWLTSDAQSDILFGRADEFKWTAALKSIGVDPMMLSGSAGRA